MKIQDFIKQNIEGYLFHDLDNIAKITLPEGEEFGAAGYPMMISILAGMELLGYLLISDTEYLPDKGLSHFTNYWNMFFTKNYPIYKPFVNLFYQLVRHGLAHNFLTKPGIYITKGAGRETYLDKSKNQMIVDCLVFYDEFKKVYHDLVLPAVENSEKKVQEQLNSIEKFYIQNANEKFNQVQTSKTIDDHMKKILDDLLQSKIHASGASLSFPPPHPVSGDNFSTNPKTKRTK